jgi:hypothetical protein
VSEPVSTPVPASPAANPAPVATGPVNLDALAAELSAQGLAKAPEAPVTTPEATAKPPEPVADEPFKKGFDKLLQQQSALRQEKEQAKHGFELAKTFSPSQAQALAQAAQSRDPMALLAAAGFSYTDVVQKMTGVQKAPEVKQPDARPSNIPAEVQAQLDELKQFKQEMTQQRAQFQARQTENAVLSKIKEVVKGEAFSHIEGLEDHAGVMGVLNEIFNKTGGFPSDDAVENIKIAAEEYERRLRENAARYAKLQKPLTTSVAPASTVPEATRESGSTATVESGKTLTNRFAAPSASPQPFNSEAVLAELAADPRFR